jgi:phage shock protein PspC (stress-responsive transcriptional regulator)
VALTLLGGAGVPLYVAAWLLIPEEGSEVAIAGEILSHSWHR